MNRRRFIRSAGLLVPVSMAPALAFPGIITQSGSRLFGASGGGGGGGTAIYSDDFESVSVGSGIGGRGNSAFSFDTANSATLSVVGSNSFAYAGSKAIKFDFKGPNASTVNCEQPFTLTSEYQELWIGFRLYIPAAYDNSGNTGGSTNKKFFALWNDGEGYSGWVTTILEFEQAGSGNSNIDVTWQDESSTTQHDIQAGNWFDKTTDAGQWLAIGLRFKAATNPRSGSGSGTTSNGIVQGWKNRSLFFTKTNVANYSPTGAGFNRGYIFGTPNGGYPSDTPFHVDDFVIADNSGAISAYLP